MNRSVVGMVVAVVAALLADAAVLLPALINRDQEAATSLELTERELRLIPRPGESTATFLELRWTTDPTCKEQTSSAPFLSSENLAALGFDCSVPLTDSEARRHYNAQPLRIAWLVLQHQPKSTNQVEAGPAEPSEMSRLVVIDAGPDAEPLRARHQRKPGLILARGLIRVAVRERSGEKDTQLKGVELQAEIVHLLPSRIFVPSQHNASLQPLQAKREGIPGDPALPRFRATVSWGIRGEPWIRSIEAL